MSTNAGARKLIKGTIVAMAAMLLILGPSAAQAAPFDITTLPGYGVATSAKFNFNAAGGWAGWSVPTGKVVLGAKIISNDPISEFSAFRPAGPGEVFPHYTFGANEYGWVMQAKAGQANNDVQMEVYYADPLAGYTITTSAQLNYSGTGWGGWSAPSGDVVSGGGFQFSTAGASPSSSQIALENSVWAHYTYGSNEQGWVVQNGGVQSNAYLYVISFDRPAPVPEPSTLTLFGLGVAGLAIYRRRFKKA